MATEDGAITGQPAQAAPAVGVTTDPADPGRILLPPLPNQPRSDNSRLVGRIRFLDGLLALLLIVFAFLVASFRASNSDIYQHLAAGRAIAEGAPVGSEPFSFAAADSWVNLSWLYDRVSYALYSATEQGGVVLVVLKALLAAATAWLMFRAGSLPGKAAWIPLVCTFLAVLALSQRLLLQPAVVSMLLLALTLFLLTRQTRGAAWLVPLVCLAWVNLDSWFLLGPATVLLFALGQLIQGGQQAPEGDAVPNAAPSVGQLFAVLAACLVACLVNPFHVRAFTALPVGVWPTAEVEPILREPLFRTLSLSPLFEARLYFQPFLGLSATGIAYVVLLAVSLLSFVLTLAWNLDGLRWWRVLVWLPFAILAALNLRGVPFFAVVAGPITALNGLDLAGRFAPAAEERPWQRLAISGRLLTLLMALVLIGASLPGWLQAQPHYRRVVGWGLEVDPGLKAAAEQINTWKTDGRIAAEQRWFNLNPEVANYLAWFCPGQRTFIDQRLELFGPAVADYLAARRALTGEEPPPEDRDGPAPPAWRRILAERQVPFVLFHSQDPGRIGAALSRLYSNPNEFVPCFLAGNTAIFAWRDPAAGQAAPSPLAIDFVAQAFGPQAQTAPEQPVRTETLPWWQEWITAERPPPGDAGTAMQELSRFDALSLSSQQRNRQTFFTAVFAALAGQAAGGPLAGGVLPQLRMAMTYHYHLGRPIAAAPQAIDQWADLRYQLFMRLQDQGPPESLYLAIRAARRGLAKVPEDVLCQLVLAEAYTRLAYRTRERSRTAVVTANGQEQPFFRHVQLIRQTQVAAALRTVLKVNPRPDRQQVAHLLLSQVFREPEYFEPRVNHLREYLRLSRELGSLPAGAPNRSREDLKTLDTYVKEAERELKNRQDEYLLNSANKPLLQRVRLAREKGLAETALDLLLRADPRELQERQAAGDGSGTTLVVMLLLGMGRVDEARDALTPDLTGGQSFDKRVFGTHPLGMPAYEWFRAQLGAATGDYAAADAHLAEAIAALEKNPLYSAVLVQLDVLPPSMAERESDRRSYVGLLVADTLLREAPQAAGLPWQWLRQLPYRLVSPHQPRRPESLANLMQGGQVLLQIQEQLADLWVLRAWLALESGRVDQVRTHLTRAGELFDLGAGPGGSRMVAAYRSRPLALLLQEMLDRKPGND